MRYTKIILSTGVAILLSSPTSIAQETGKKTTTAEGGAATRIEPLRVINGEMRGRTVSGRFERGARGTNFTFTLAKAEVVRGRLQLSGDFTLDGGGARLTDQGIATIAGAIAAAVNPLPHAGDEPRNEAKKSRKEEEKTGEQRQGREARNPEAAGQLGQLAQSTQDTARKTPPAPGEKTEQTQSLYAQSETVAGCGVIFLKLVLPNRLRVRMGAVPGPLQVGVVFNAFDNELSQEINRQICRFSQTIETRDQSTSLDRLNRLLSSSR